MHVYMYMYAQLCVHMCLYSTMYNLCVYSTHIWSVLYVHLFQDTKDKSKMESELISKWCIVP